MLRIVFYLSNCNVSTSLSDLKSNAPSYKFEWLYSNRIRYFLKKTTNYLINRLFGSMILLNENWFHTISIKNMYVCICISFEYSFLKVILVNKNTLCDFFQRIMEFGNVLEALTITSNAGFLRSVRKSVSFFAFIFPLGKVGKST